MSDVIELFGYPTSRSVPDTWLSVVRRQECPFLKRGCIKVRKSEPEVAIGTCAVYHGRARKPIVICPFRLLERQQVFVDCMHLLSVHEPGNELHIVPEVSVPGGSVDYFLVFGAQWEGERFRWYRAANVGYDWYRLARATTVSTGGWSEYRPRGRCQQEEVWHELENDSQDHLGSTAPQDRDV